jgi:hypothetical protein
VLCIGEKKELESKVLWYQIYTTRGVIDNLEQRCDGTPFCFSSSSSSLLPSLSHYRARYFHANLVMVSYHSKPRDIVCRAGHSTPLNYSQSSANNDDMTIRRSPIIYGLGLDYVGGIYETLCVSMERRLMFGYSGGGGGRWQRRVLLSRSSGADGKAYKAPKTACKE